MQQEQRRCFVINVLYYGSILLIAALLLRYVLGWVLPFVLGFGIAVLLKPVTDYLARRSTFRRRGAALFVVSLFYLAVSLLIWLLGSLLLSELSLLLDQLPADYMGRIEPMLARLNAWVEHILAFFSPAAGGQLGHLMRSVSAAMETALVELSTMAVGALTDIARQVPLFLITVIFSIVSSILITVDYQPITRFLMRQLPMRWQQALCSSKNFLVGSLGRLLRAYVILLGLTFLQLAAGLWLIGVEYSLPIAFFIAVLDILPVLGTGGFLIPWALLELFGSTPLRGVELLILYGIITLVRNITEPKIVGSQLGLHPIVTLTALYAGMRIAGFWGLVGAPMLVLLLKHLNQSGKIRLYR